jgi:hypothetical protein
VLPSIEAEGFGVYKFIYSTEVPTGKHDFDWGDGYRNFREAESGELPDARLSGPNPPSSSSLEHNLVTDERGCCRQGSQMTTSLGNPFTNLVILAASEPERTLRRFHPVFVQERPTHDSDN